MSKTVSYLVAVLSFLLLPSLKAHALTTAFYYTSSPNSWVGGGQTVLVTPDDGFLFAPGWNYDNGLNMWINDFVSNPDFFSERYWSIDFALAGNAPLTVGTYYNATRFPFQSSSEHGFSFSGNHRGNGSLLAHFSILEYDYTYPTVISSFAADFIQFDEGMPSKWNFGSIRYNSGIPLTILGVPEPETYAMFLAGLGLLGAAMRRKKQA